MLPAAIAVAVVGGYAAVSWVLLRHPALLHTLKAPDGRMWRAAHISHRGGAAERLENTLEAFRHAAEVGTDMLELDVHLTRDKQVVVSHDGSLLRLAGIEGRIEDVAYADLPPLRPELAVTFGGGSASGTDRRIPLLEDVLEAFPDLAMSVDLKADDDDLVAAVGDLLRKHHREAYTMWGSFRPSVCRKCATKDPTIGRFCSAPKVCAIYGLYYSGLLPFCPLSEAYIALPFFRALKVPTLAQRPLTTAILDFLACAPGLFRHLRARGIPVYLWVVNDEASMLQAFAVGANGVMTDRPTTLRQVLDQHPLLPLSPAL